MSDSTFKVNISGGNMNVGNINQGDNATLTAHQTIHIAEADLKKFYQEITELAKGKGVTDSDYLRLRNTVNQLVKQESQSDIVTAAKNLYETYAWAAKPLMALFSAVLP